MFVFYSLHGKKKFTMTDNDADDTLGFAGITGASMP
jgi:hypothetical protein